jgi:hypothetical protein
MRLERILGLCVVIAATGCQKADPDMKPSGPVNLSHRPANEAMLENYNVTMIDNAIIRQHTLYAYHFEQYGAELNELGRREADVLARHYRKYPGPVNLHQGEESDAIYQARIESLRQRLVQSGVDASRIAIGQDLPGGDGLPANQVVIVLNRMNTSKLSGASAPGTDVSDDGSSMGGEDTSATTGSTSNQGTPQS